MRTSEREWQRGNKKKKEGEGKKKPSITNATQQEVFMFETTQR